MLFEYQQLIFNSDFTAEILPIFVAKDYKRKRVGTRLIREVNHYFKETKVRELSVVTLVQNISALAFYHQLKFVDIRKIKDYIILKLAS